MTLSFYKEFEHVTKCVAELSRRQTRRIAFKVPGKACIYSAAAPTAVYRNTHLIAIVKHS